MLFSMRLSAAVDALKVPYFINFLLPPKGLSFIMKDFEAVLPSLLSRATEFSFDVGFSRRPF